MDDSPGADPAVPDYWYETSQGNDPNDAEAPVETHRSSPTGLAAYPDVTVVCGEPERDPDGPTTVVNPRVVVEVLGDGTEAYDRGQTLDHHRQIPSLAAVVLVSHRSPAIEIWDRGSAWRRREFGLGALADLPTLSAGLAVDEVYLGFKP